MPRKPKSNLSTGTLPEEGAAKLTRVFETVEEKFLAEGMEPHMAAERAAQIAWSEVKRHYYKRGKKWMKRKRPLKQGVKRNISVTTNQAVHGIDAARTLMDLEEVLALANGASSRTQIPNLELGPGPQQDLKALKRRLMR